MILVDSSIWIDHLRHNNVKLQALLEAGQVLTHSFIIGELALGNLRQRTIILSSLRNLPLVVQANDEEVCSFIEQHTLAGRGIGYIDAHLLASAQLAAAPLWTRDKRLHAVAAKLGLIGI